MDRMVMISLDSFEDMKRNRTKQKNKEDEIGSKDPPDVEMKKRNDQYVKSVAKEKNQADQEMEEFSKRLKPLLSLHTNSIEEIIKKIPSDKQEQASFLIQVLSRLPKVSIQRDRLMIDGEPLSTPASDIIKEMMSAGIGGTKNIINAMRYKGKVRVEKSDEDNDSDDSEAYHSLADEVLPLTTPRYRNRSIASSTPYLKSNLKKSLKKTRFTPYKKRNVATPLLKKVLKYEGAEESEGQEEEEPGAIAALPSTQKSRKKKTPGVKTRVQPSRLKSTPSKTPTPAKTLKYLKDQDLGEEDFDLPPNWDRFA